MNTEEELKREIKKLRDKNKENHKKYNIKYNLKWKEPYSRYTLLDGRLKQHQEDKKAFQRVIDKCDIVRDKLDLCDCIIIKELKDRVEKI